MTCLLFSSLLLIIQDRFTDRQLVVTGLAVLCMAFTGITIGAVVPETIISGDVFFGLIIGAIVLSAVGAVFFGVGGCRLAANLKDIYITSLNTGQGSAGIVISALYLTSIYLELRDERETGRNEQLMHVVENEEQQNMVEQPSCSAFEGSWSAFLQFGFVLVFFVVALGVYFYLEYNVSPELDCDEGVLDVDDSLEPLLIAPGSVEHDRLIEKMELEASSSCSPSKQSWVKRTSQNLRLLQKRQFTLVAMLFCFLVTISVYPSVSSLVHSTAATKSPEHPDQSTKLLIGWMFMMFNFCDFMGRFSTGFYFIENQKLLCALSVSRFLFIPAFLSMNFDTAVESTSDLGLVFGNTSAMLLHVLLGFSNGFLCSNAYILAPKTMSTKEEKNIATTACSLALSVGLVGGASLSFPLVRRIA